MDKRGVELDLLKIIPKKPHVRNCLVLICASFILFQIVSIITGHKARDSAISAEWRRANEIVSIAESAGSVYFGDESANGFMDRLFDLNGVVSLSVSDREGRIVFPPSRYGTRLDVRGVCSDRSRKIDECSTDGDGVYRLSGVVRTKGSTSPAGYVLLEFVIKQKAGARTDLWRLLATLPALAILGVVIAGRDRVKPSQKDLPSREGLDAWHFYAMWLDIAEVAGWGLFLFDSRYRLIDLNEAAEKWLDAKLGKKGTSIVEICKKLPMGGRINGLLKEIDAGGKPLAVGGWNGPASNVFRLAVFKCNIGLKNSHCGIVMLRETAFGGRNA